MAGPRPRSGTTGDTHPAPMPGWHRPSWRPSGRVRHLHTSGRPDRRGAVAHSAGPCCPRHPPAPGRTAGPGRPPGPGPAPGPGPPLGPGPPDRLRRPADPGRPARPARTPRPGPARTGRPPGPLIARSPEPPGPMTTRTRPTGGYPAVVLTAPAARQAAQLARVHRQPVRRRAAAPDRPPRGRRRLTTGGRVDHLNAWHRLCRATGRAMAVAATDPVCT